MAAFAFALCAGLLAAGSAHAQLFLNVNKSFSPISPGVGQTSSLVITLNNTSPGTSATVVAGTDTLPSGLAYVSAGSGTCGLTPSVGSLYVGGGTLTWSGGTIPGNSSCTITAVVTPIAAGTWVNTIPSSGVSGFVGAATVSGFSTASATITSAGTLAGLTGTKTASSTVLHGGGTQSFTITLTNPNAIPSTGTGYTDTLPVTMVVAVPGGVSSNSCGGSTVNTVGGALADGNLGFSLQGGTIPANGSCSVTLVVRTANNTTSQQQNAITNSIGAGGITTTQGITNAAAINGAMRIERGVTISKSFTPATILAGGTSSLAIVISNYNLASIASAGLTDTFPAGVTGQSLQATNGCGAPTVTVTSGSVTFPNATLPVAPSATANGPGVCTITVVVTAAAAGAFANTIAAGAFTGGFAYAAANATLTVNNAGPVISGTKTFAPVSVVPGGTSLLTIVLGNSSTGVATAVGYTDNLATTMGQSVTIAVSPAATNSCGGSLVATSGATSFTLSGGTIGATATCTITVPILAASNAAPGVRTNSLPAGSVSTSLGTNTAAINANLTILPALSGTKVFNLASIPQGGTSLLTLTLTNTSTAVATALAFTDNLLSTMGLSVTIAITPAATNSCGGTLVANSGSTSFSLSAGSLAAASSCVITLPVQVAGNATTGLRTNSIPAGSVTSSVGSTTANINGGLTITADLSVTKAFLPTSIAQGGTSVLTITLLNAAGGANASITSMTETLTTMGAGITIASAPATSNNCGGVLSAVAGSTAISMTGGTIIAGGSCQITVPVVAAGNAATGARTNTIPAGNLQTNQGANTNPATAILTLTNPLTVAKAYNPTNVGPGQTTTLSITLNHANFSPPFTNLSFVDSLPAGHTVGTPPLVTNTCGGTVVANAGSTSFSLTGGGLPSGTTSCVITLSVQAPASVGSAVNTVVVGSVTTAEGISNAVAANATLTRVSGSAASLNKQFSPININGGSASALTVFITNPNAFALTNVRLTDAMPAGMTVAPVPAASTNCAGGAVSGSSGAAAFTLTGGTVAANGTCSFQINVTSAVGGNSINTIPAGTMTSVQGVTNGNAPSATLQVLFNLNVGKAFSPIQTQAGLTSSLIVTIYNSNTTTVAGVNPSSMVDNLPAGLVIASPVSSTGCGGSVTNTSGLVLTAGDTGFRLNGGSFAAGTQCNVTVIVKTSVVTATGSFVNTIAASTLATVGGATNPTPAVATVTFLATPVLTKAFNPNSIAPGAQSTVTFTLTNTNTVALTPSGLSNVRFTDTLPAGLSIYAPGAAGGTCTGASGNSFSAGQTVLAFSGISVGAAASCTIAVVVTASTTNAYVNTVSGVLSVETPSPSTSVATATLTVLANPTVAKSFVPASITSGGTGTSVLTITLSNANGTPLLLASPGMVDVFPTSPGAMVYVATNSNSCVGGTLQNNAGGALVSGTSVGLRLNAATIPAAGSCSVSVVVQSPIAGVYLNSMPAVTSTNAGSSASGATASFTVVQGANLSVSKTNNVTSLPAGSTTFYDITVANAGPADATGTVLRDVPSVGLLCTSMTCAASGGATCPANDVPTLLGAGLSIPGLPSGGQVVVTLSCGVTATGQ